MLNDRMIQRLASLLTLSAELFRIQQKSSHAPRSVAADLLHSKKKLLGAERRFISETAFLGLRQTSLLVHCVGGTVVETDIVVAALLIGALEGTVDLDKHIRDIAAARDIQIPDPGTAESLLIAAREVVLQNPAAAGISGARNKGSGKANLDEQDFRETIFRRYQDLDAKVSDLLNQSGKDTAIDDVDYLELFALRYSMPVWLAGRLSKLFRTPERLAGLLSRLNQPAPVDLRANTSVLNRRQVGSLLRDSGIETTELKLTPSGLRMKGRHDITELEVFRKGAVEVQDLGSQVIGLALNPAPGWHILDACAGAGGKSLHLADLQQNSGSIIAADVESNRLRSLQQRAQRCGFTSVTTLRVNSDGSARRSEDEHLLEDASFDAVLVDAPCSGIGTVRRNPQIKWKLSEKGLGRLAGRQLAILEQNALRVRRGGVLIYATCSLLPDENSDVVKRFLQNNPEFHGDDLGQTLNEAGVSASPDRTAELPDRTAEMPARAADLPDSATKSPVGGSSFMLSLSPFDHGTDGFFVARMRRD